VRNRQRDSWNRRVISAKWRLRDTDIMSGSMRGSRRGSK
jgi:hypothetical protein